MIRTVLAASLILATGSAFARDIPSYQTGAAGVARNLGNTASPAYAYGPADPRARHTVETTGSIVVRPQPQKVMGLPVPGEY
jgi:hypothetical protein